MIEWCTPVYRVRFGTYLVSLFAYFYPEELRPTLDSQSKQKSEHNVSVPSILCQNNSRQLLLLNVSQHTGTYLVGTAQESFSPVQPQVRLFYHYVL